MLAKDLTETQRQLFYKFFNKICEWDLENTEWGCPWEWTSDINLHGDTVEQMATWFYLENKKEIRELITQ